MTISQSAGSTDTLLSPLSGTEEQLFNELTAALAPRIQVVSLLGRGGMALVFLGRDPLLKRPIAIKVLSPEFAGSEVARTRFTREAQAAATMTHPNVAAVYDVGELPTGTPYFLMQFLDGRSLAEVIASEGMFAETRARRVIGEVASALAMAHQHGLVHRDVKPANIIIENESQKAVVVDFGISSAMNKEQFADGGGTLTAIGTYVGTPRYTSPEQAASEPVSGKTDVYSLGIVAYELLTGKVPFEATNPMALLAAHIKDVPPPIRTLRPDVDASFAAMLDRCLLKNPAARPEASEIASFLLPEPQAAMEWPPPGLDDLRGQGARTATAFNWFGAFASAFVLALGTQPTRGTPEFTQIESSLLWSMVANMWADTGNTETPDATPVWLFVLLLSFVGAFVAFIVYALRAARLFGSVRHGKRQGYSLPVLAAVAADGHGDTSELLNRRGRYAVLSAAQQNRLVQARRLSWIVLPGAFLLLAVLMLNWFGGMVSTESSTLLTPGLALVMLVPVGLGLVVSAYLFTLEAPLRRGSLWTGSTRLATRLEFVQDWLRRLKNPEQLRFAPAALVIPAIGLFAGVALLVALGLAGLALTIATRNVARSAGSGSLYSYAFDNWSWTDHVFVDYLQRLDSSFGSARRPQPNDSASRLYAIEQLAMVAHAPEHLQQFDHDDSARVVAYAEAARKALVSLGAGTLDTKAHDDANAARALARFRQFARTTTPQQSSIANLDQYPPYSYPTEELLEEFAEGRLLIPWSASAGTDSANAACKAYVAARRYADCRALAEDLIRAAVRLTASPVENEYERGVGLAVEGSRFLELVARGLNDPALLARASDVERRATAVYRRRWSPGLERERYFRLLWGYAGNLNENSYARALVHSPQARPYRAWTLVQNYVTAFCTSAHEILFGVSPRRHELIRDVRGRLGERGLQWVRIQSSILDRWIEDPDVEFARRMPEVAAEASLLDPIKWIGLRRLHARLRFCAAPGLVSW